MSLKAILDSLEGIPEAQQSLYRPAEGDLTGKFILDIEPVAGFNLENVDGLKSSLLATKSELDASKDALKAYDGLKGLKPSTISEKLRKLERLEKFDPETEADKIAAQKMQASIDELTNKHKTELETVTGRNSRLQGEVERLLVQDAATSAITKHKGSAALLLPHVKNRVKVKDVDGTFVVEVVNEQGQTDYSIRDGKPVPATIEDLVVRLKTSAEFGRAFDAEASGSGARQGTGGAGPTNNPFSKKTLNLTEQMRITKDNPAMAESLRARAAAEG